MTDGEVFKSLSSVTASRSVYRKTLLCWSLINYPSIYKYIIHYSYIVYGRHAMVDNNKDTNIITTVIDL